MKRALRNILVATAGCAVIAACGGGSSDGGSLTGGDNTAEFATITTENAAAIAGVAAEVAMGQGGFSSIFTTDLPTASIGAGAAVAPVMKPVLSAAIKTASPSQLYATSAALESCAVSGSVDVQVNVSDPMQPSVNDQFVFAFTDCDDGSGVVVNGGMTITIITLGGDVASGNFLFGMQIQFSAFAVTEGGETVTADGTISIEVDTSNPTLTRIAISTSSFVTTSGGTEEVLTSFTVEIIEDASQFPVAVTLETSFTISSPRVGGSVAVTTSRTLQSSGSDYPFAGELRITGADGAAIVMIALDANTVRLEIDIDGDGAADDTVDLTWDELMAAAG